MRNIPVSAFLLCLTCLGTAETSTGGLSYIENKGQWDHKASFLAKFGGLNMWVTKDGALYDFFKLSKREVKGQVVKMTLVGSSPSTPAGVLPEAGTFNYFLGSDPSHWATKVQRFSEAHVREVYKGISIRYYFDHGLPRYDFLVAPQADPSQIKIRFDGANSLQVLANGHLQLETGLGPVEEKELLAYQRVGNNRTIVASHMRLAGNVLSFSTAPYDKTKPLVIDPLLFSTFLGGSNGDFVTGVKVDSSANVVVTGDTMSTNFPTTVGAYDRVGPAGGFNYDAFVAKLLSDGSSLLFGTYLGASTVTHVHGLALDSTGDPIIVGDTAGSYPTTTGAYHTTYSGASVEGFVTKLRSDGAGLIFSSYLGGAGDSYAESVVSDSTGNIYVGGITYGAFPTTGGAHQTTFAGNNDGFLAKLDSAGTTLLAGTYLGPNYETFLQGVAVDSSDNPLVAGYTDALGFPVSAGAYQSVNHGSWDGFVTKFNTDLTSITASSLFGGSDADYILSLDVDPSDQPMVTGYTLSTDYPTSLGAIQSSTSAMTNRGTAFYTKLNSSETAVAGSTYYGGGQYGNQGNAIASDGSGNPIIVGNVTSSGLVTTPGAYQISSPGGNDAFVAKISGDGTALYYGSYLGGSTTDEANAVGLDAISVPHIGGETNSPDFPVSSAAYQKHPGTNYVATGFVTKMKLIAAWYPISFIAPPVFYAGNGATGTLKINTPAPSGGTSITITSNNAAATVTSPVVVAAGGLTVNTTIISHPSSTSNQVVTLTATTPTGSSSATFTVKPAPLFSITVSSVSLIAGQFLSGNVVINGTAPVGGDVVSLASSNHAILQVPISTTITSGNSFSGFNSSTAGSPPVPTSLAITATLNGISRHVNIIVYPTVWLTVPPTFSSGNGSAGTVHLASPAGGSGQMINFSSSNTSAMTVQNNVLVGSGASTASFAMTSHAVGVNTPVTINANSSIGNATGTTSVIPAPLYSVTTSSGSVVGGGSLTGTVTINGLAPPGGAIVSLNSSSPAALTVPVNATILSGGFHVNFAVQSHPVGSVTSVTITAQYKGVIKTVVVQVH